jgi:hypothetical protein
VTVRTDRSAAASGIVGYEGTVALVRTTDGGTVDRQLVALDQRLTILPFLTVFNLVEVDLYSGAENPLDRPGVDLTSVHLALRARPVKDLDVGVAYDRRRPFYGTREVEDLGPATVEEIETDILETYRADARLAFGPGYFVRVSADLFRGGGDGRALGIEAGADAIGGTPLRLSGGGTVSWARDTDTVRLFARAALAIGRNLHATLAYAVTRYDSATETDTGGDRAAGLRHEPRAGIDWLITSSLSLHADVGYESGDDIDRLSVSTFITYRF